MKVHENGDVTFTRNEVFVIGSGVIGLINPGAKTYEVAAAALLRHLPVKLHAAEWKFVVISAQDIALGGDVGVFTGL